MPRPGRYISHWKNDSATLNSIYAEVTKPTGTACTPPAYHPLAQETARTWENAFKGSSYFCSDGQYDPSLSDAYLDHLKLGIKLDTFSALRYAPLQIGALFPDQTFHISQPRLVSGRFSGKLETYLYTKAYPQ